MLVAEILAEAADACHADLAATRSGCRRAECTRARFAAIWVARHRFAHCPSLPVLGRQFRMDQSTIGHALRRAEQLRRNDPDFRNLTDWLLEEARPQPAELEEAA